MTKHDERGQAAVEYLTMAIAFVVVAMVVAKSLKHGTAERLKATEMVLSQPGP